MPPVELKSLVQEIVDRITIGADRIEIQLSRAKIAAALQVGESGQRPDLDPIVLLIEAKVRRAGNGKRLVIGNDARSDVNEDLVELIKEACTIRNQFLSGSDASIEAMTERLGMGKGHLTSLVRLSYLAPGIGGDWSVTVAVPNMGRWLDPGSCPAGDGATAGRRWWRAPRPPPVRQLVSVS